MSYNYEVKLTKVLEHLGTDTLLHMLNDLADTGGFSKTPEAAIVVALIKDELEDRELQGRGK